MNKVIERERVKAFVAEMAGLFSAKKPPPLAVVDLRALLKAVYGDTAGRMTVGRWADLDAATKKNGLNYIWNTGSETVVFLPLAPENKDDDVVEAAFERFYEKMGTGR